MTEVVKLSEYFGLFLKHNIELCKSES